MSNQSTSNAPGLQAPPSAVACLNDLQAGKAGEHLVCADLIIQGYAAFLAGDGLAYDVVVQLLTRLVKVQVKSIRQPLARRDEPPLYHLSGLKRGKNRKSRYTAEHADLFAVVALDERIVGYLPIQAIRLCMEFRAESHRGNYMSERFNRAAIRAGALHDAGKGLNQIAEEMGVSRPQAHRYLRAFGEPKVKGKYLRDLPFGEAIRTLSG